MEFMHTRRLETIIEECFFYEQIPEMSLSTFGGSNTTRNVAMAEQKAGRRM